MSDRKQPVSIIVPILNEAENLPVLFSRIDQSLTAADIPYEIVVIDDNSTDTSADIARSASNTYPIRLVTKKGSAGKAQSLLQGFSAASYDIICMIDGDLQYPPEAIGAMYHKLEYCDADIILTNRIDNQTSTLRRLSSSTFNFLFTRVLFGIDYDTQSGLKLFKKSVLNTMELTPSPWSFDLEFIVRALENGCKVFSYEIPFSKRYAGVPKINVFSGTFELAHASLKLRRQSSKKTVRGNFKSLQLLERSFAWAAITFVAVLGLSLHNPAHSDALSLGGIVRGITGQNDSTNAQPASPTQQPASDSTPAQPKTMVAPTTSNTAPSTTNQAAGSSQATASAGSQNTATSSPNGSSATAPATATPTGQTGSAAGAPASGTATTGKQANYYQKKSLSANKTSTLQRVALLALESGGVLIAVGAMIIAVKKINTRINRHQSVQA